MFLVYVDSAYVFSICGVCICFWYMWILHMFLVYVEYPEAGGDLPEDIFDRGFEEYAYFFRQVSYSSRNSLTDDVIDRKPSNSSNGSGGGTLRFEEYAYFFRQVPYSSRNSNLFRRPWERAGPSLPAPALVYERTPQRQALFGEKNTNGY